MNKFFQFFALFTPVFFLSILIVFQVSFTINYLPLEITSVPIAFIAGLYISKRYLKPLNLLLLASILIASGIYSYYLFDKAGDGRWYHQQTMILLKYLWNPLNNYSNLKVADPFIFSKSYPIANETIATGFYLITTSIQIGKSINTIFIFYCISICYLFLEEFSGITKRIDILLISLLISFNPIACSQLFSYYLDANLLCCFVILLFSSYAYLYSLKRKEFWLVNLLSSFWLLSNIKATGLIYAICIIVLIDIFCYLKDKICFNYRILIILIFGECFLGWHPYLQNILTGHNIFWPVIGKANIDILTNLDASPYPKMLYPLLSYLIPYPVNFDVTTWFPDFRIYVRTDARFGACGPFFGLLLLGSGWILYKNIKYKQLQENKVVYMIFVMNIIVVATTLINPKWWFAKYVPQICLLPIFALTLIIINHARLWNKYKQLILFIFTLNSALFLCGSLILTGYRSYLFFNMERMCQKEMCVLMHTDNPFKISLIQQLKDDNINYSLGKCYSNNIIWEDARINGKITNVVCHKGSAPPIPH